MIYEGNTLWVLHVSQEQTTLRSPTEHRKVSPGSQTKKVIEKQDETITQAKNSSVDAAVAAATAATKLQT